MSMDFGADDRNDPRSTSFPVRIDVTETPWRGTKAALTQPRMAVLVSNCMNIIFMWDGFERGSV
jgi:hypothetical protein